MTLSWRSIAWIAASILACACGNQRDPAVPVKAATSMKVPIYVVHLIPDVEPIVVDVDRSDTAAVVQLKLALPAGPKFSTYRAEIKGGIASTVMMVPPGGGDELDISLKTLQWRPGLYRLTLSGVTAGGASKPVAEYRFRLM